MKNLFSLQNYTTYSILSGLGKVEKWVERAEELGHSYLGVSEKQNLASALKIQQECKGKDIEPIFGSDFQVTDDLEDKSGRENIKYRVLLYAKTYEGWKNLISLNNFSWRRDGGFYYKPRVANQIIEKYSDDLICVLPSIRKNVEFFDEDIDKAYELRKIFEEDFYLGLNPLDEEWGGGLAERLPWKSVLVFNAHMPKEGQDHLYDAVRKIDKSSRKKHFNLDREVNNGFLPTQEDIDKHFEGDEEIFEEACQSLQEVAEKCSGVEIPTGDYFIPSVPMKAKTVKKEIKRKILKGFKEKLCSDVDLHWEDFDDFDQLREWGDRLPQKQKERGLSDLDTLDVYIDRVEREFNTIEDMGFLEYFLSTDNIVQAAKNDGWEVGNGRGSAAGSLLCYLMDITKIDSVWHGLLFERFINPDRNDLPDIDLDFEKQARDPVKQHIKEQWGETKFCSIGTYDRMKVVSAVKNLARANHWGIPDNAGNIVSYNQNKINNIMANLHTTQTSRGEDELEELREYEAFEDFYQKHSNWFDEYIMPLQETVVGRSVHAAGVIVTDEPIDRCVPAWEHSDSSKGIISQWEDSSCEKRGYVKFDVLGLKNLDKVGYAKRLIKERHDVEIPDWEDIPLDDQKAMEFFAHQDTEGLFQFLTYSQQKFHKRINPEVYNFLLLCHAVALIRPGPQKAGADDAYVKVANGEEEATYDHEDLQEILEETNGVLVLQEQLMKIVKKIGGLTGSQADYVRKACGKKDHEEMEKWEEKFKEGGKENGYDEELLNLLWDKIVGFAEYGFNKAHAVSYTALSYYQAWIRARYPVEWWSAVMQSASGNEHKEENKYDYKHIVEDKGIDFIFPNIHGFSERFEPAGEESIYWPLDAIGGIGSSSSDTITQNGTVNSYESMEEMLNEFTNKTIYKALVKAWFFDPICPPWEAMERFVELRKDHGFNDEVPYEMSHQDWFEWTRIRNETFKMIVRPWKDLADFTDDVESYKGDKLSEVSDGSIVNIGGIVDKIYNKETKNGDDYGTIYLKDDGEEIKIQCWSAFWANTELDKRGLRPQNGDLIQVIALKDSWSPEDSDRVYHQVSLGTTRNPNVPDMKSPRLISKVGFSEGGGLE